MISKNNKKAFTLPEVLVSIAVIVMVVMAATNLLVASIRANAVNVSTLVAYGLAQEGIEAVRNIRDSDWLLGANFRGEAGRQNVAPWGDTLPSAEEGARHYTVEFRDPLDMEVKNTLQLSNVVPWKLKGLTGDRDYGKSPDTVLYLKEFGSAKERRYVHMAQSAESTPFHRYIEVTPVTREPDGGKTAARVVKYRVASVVNWEEYGRDREVKLITELTDWKRN